MNKQEAKHPLFLLTISAFLHRDKANQKAANTMHHHDVNILFFPNRKQWPVTYRKMEHE